VRLVAVFLLLFPSLATAHSLFFTHGDGAWRLVRGHPGDGDTGPCHDLVHVRLLVFTDGGTTLLAETDGAGAVVPDSLLPPAGAALVAVADWGAWTKTPDGTRHAPPSRVDSPLESWRSLERLVLLLDPAAPPPPAAGRGLELQPLVPPATVRPGHKLRVRVTLDGAPVAGVPVAYGEDVRGVTDDRGEINIRLRHGGLQLLRASLRRPDPSGTCDRLVRSATLQFDLEDR